MLFQQISAKEFTKDYQFSDDEEQIHFFKHISPAFHSHPDSFKDRFSNEAAFYFYYPGTRSVLTSRIFFRFHTYILFKNPRKMT